MSADDFDRAWGRLGAKLGDLLISNVCCQAGFQRAFFLLDAGGLELGRTEDEPALHGDVADDGLLLMSCDAFTRHFACIAPSGYG